MPQKTDAQLTTDITNIKSLITADGKINAAELQQLLNDFNDSKANNSDIVAGSDSTGWTNVKSFGATGDGTTDDTSAIQSAIASMTNGGVLYFPPGSYKVTSGLVITKRTHVMGCGVTNAMRTPFGSPHPAGGITRIFTPNSIDLFRVNTTAANGSMFSNMFLEYTGVSAPTQGAGIRVDAGDGNRYFQVATFRFYDGIKINDGAEWFMYGCTIFQPYRYGLYVEHQDLPDGGDGSVINCQFIACEWDSLAGIYQIGSGGLRIVGNKFNNRGGGSGRFNNCILNQTVADTTVISIIANNSFENMFDDAIVIQNLPFVIINGNEFAWYRASQASFVNLTNCSSSVIYGNVGWGPSANTEPFIKLTNCDRVKVSLNIWDGDTAGSGYGFTAQVGQTGCTNITIT